MNPTQRIGVVPMATLVNDKVQPLLVSEAFPRPKHAEGMGRYRRVGASAKGRTSDALPSLATVSFVGMVSCHDPDDVMGAIA